MPKDRKFVNPLTQPSTFPDTSTKPETLPATETSTSPSTSTYTSTQSQTHRHRGEQAFEKTHERVTLWLEKSYKRRLTALADKEGVAKSTLLDEAVRDLLEKYNAWDL